MSKKEKKTDKHEKKRTCKYYESSSQEKYIKVL